jgi:DHA1 family tetracycline resistance protein-like MFS transporter
MGTGNGTIFIIAIFIICLPMFNATSQALMTRHVGESEQGELQGAIGSVRGISMVIGPSVFTLTFAQFIGPWRGLHIPGAAFYLAAAMYVAAWVLAWRVTSRRDDVVLPAAPPAPVTYVEG